MNFNRQSTSNFKMEDIHPPVKTLQKETTGTFAPPIYVPERYMTVNGKNFVFPKNCVLIK